MQIKRLLRLLAAATITNVVAIGITSAAIDTVVVVGSKCGDNQCASGPFYGQQLDYDPFLLVGGVAGNGSKELQPGANTRTTPTCLREQVAQNAVQASLRGGNNPGLFLYSNLGDPRLSGPYWGKYQINFVVTITDGVMVTGTATVSIHYEYNRATGQYTSPPHFNSSPEAGCRN